METPSQEDDRKWQKLGPVLHGLSRPVSRDELTRALKDMDDTAAGLDGVNRSMLRSADWFGLLGHMDLWLFAGISPRAFREGYTSLGEKSGANTVSNHRPITVSLIVARLFHRILAGRLTITLPLSPRQKAFMKTDGWRRTSGCCVQLGDTTNKDLDRSK